MKNKIKKGKILNSNKILEIAVNVLNNKKARELSCIEITELSTIADYFVLATATSSTHVRALADEVEESLSKSGFEPLHIEGRATDWILLDYDDIVIHIFGKQSREFYSLDHMWNEGKQVDLTEILDTPLED